MDDEPVAECWSRDAIARHGDDAPIHVQAHDGWRTLCGITTSPATWEFMFSAPGNLPTCQRCLRMMTAEPGGEFRQEG